MKHGYGCPYHYGPINYGPEAPDDPGDDCTCEVCMTPDLVVTVKTYPSLVRVPLRLRIWYRWQQLRHRKAMLMQEAFYRELEYRFLFGEPTPLADRLAPYTYFIDHQGKRWVQPVYENGWGDA